MFGPAGDEYTFCHRTGVLPPLRCFSFNGPRNDLHRACDSDEILSFTGKKLHEVWKNRPTPRWSESHCRRFLCRTNTTDSPRVVSALPHVPSIRRHKPVPNNDVIDEAHFISYEIDKVSKAVFTNGVCRRLHVFWRHQPPASLGDNLVIVGQLTKRKMFGMYEQLVDGVILI